MTIGGSGVTGLSEFSVKLDRGVASHPRSGEEADLNLPGKLNVTGTIKRIQIDTTYLANILAGDLLLLVGTNGTDTVTVTDAFLTGGIFKITDAGEILSDDLTFAVKDASATNPAIA
jgi:hypothetical protein